MANQVVRLFVDTRQKRLVAATTSSSPVSPPPFVQGDTVTLVITLLEPNASGGVTAPFTKVSVSGLSCKVGIGTPTAATGTVAPGIYQNTFTLDTTNQTLTGELYITPATVASLLGTSTSGTSTLEIEVAEAGNYTTVYSGQCTLQAELIEAAAADPTPVDSYLTSAESKATFAKRFGLAGESITLTSPDGSQQAILYVDDDGVFHSDVTTV